MNIISFNEETPKSEILNILGELGSGQYYFRVVPGESNLYIFCNFEITDDMVKELK